ncbi:MAG: UDP-glucose 4-epimerase GalE [Flavobacteriales bacterium]
MKILVTGGAGYIGAHAIIELVEQGGHEIVSIDNHCNSSPETFERIRSITGIEIKNYTTDISDAAETETFFKQHDDIEGIIHFAALKSVGESMSFPLRYYRNNVSGLINVIEGALQTGCKYFVFSSSCTVYGNIAALPVSENTPLNNAESVYGYTKQIGERMLEDAVRSNPGAMRAISLRYFNPVGAHSSGLIGELPSGKPENLLPSIVSTAAGMQEQMTVFGDDYNTRDGSCIRDYVHVCDIARAHILALEHMKKSSEKNYDVFNLGTGEGVSVLEMISAFERNTGKSFSCNIGPRRKGDIEAIYSDCSKAEKLLGWKAKRTVDDMLLSAWKWQQHLMASNGDSPRP